MITMTLISWVVFLILEYLLDEVKRHKYLRKSCLAVFAPLLNIISRSCGNDLYFMILFILMILSVVSFRRRSVCAVILTVVIAGISLMTIVVNVPILAGLLLTR